MRELLQRALDSGALSAEQFETLEAEVCAALGQGVVLTVPQVPHVSEFRHTGKMCSVCGFAQYDTPGGPCCENGHGGAAAQGDV